MAVITTEVHGFHTIPDLFNSLVTFLLANGCTQKFPGVGGTLTDTITLEVGPTIDPLHSTEPYRIRLFATENILQINTGTDVQLPDSGILAAYDVPGSLLESDEGVIITRTSGLIGRNQFLWTLPIPTDNPLQTGTQAEVSLENHVDEVEHFIDRTWYTTEVERRAFPMSYKVSITTHGLAIAVWETGSDAAMNSQSWFVVQRSVNNSTGVVRTTGQTPVFCLFQIQRRTDPSYNYPNNIWTVDQPNRNKLGVNFVGKFVIREKHVVRPSEQVDATMEHDDVLQSVPSKQQVTILEDGSYNIKFVGGLNTHNYTYPLDELDMIAYTSADVISSNFTISLPVYGEVTPRKYFSLSATGEDNTNTRFLMIHE